METSSKCQVKRNRELENDVVTKKLSCGAVVEIHGLENGIKVLTFTVGPNDKKMCIGRRIFTEKDLTGGEK